MFGRLNINNPGNIRISSDLFQGEIQPSTDPAFKQFSTMAYGYRAMFRILDTYSKKYGIHTISGIISRWAPPSENDTTSYINFVADKTGIPAFAPISIEDKDSMTKLAYAISWYENGQYVNTNEISEGYDLATGFASQITDLVPDSVRFEFNHRPLLLFTGTTVAFGTAIFLIRKLRK